MQQELVEFEKEEETEKRIKEKSDDDELALAEIRPKSTPEKVRYNNLKY